MCATSKQMQATSGYWLTDLSEAERTLPFQKFQSSFSHHVSFLLLSPFPLFFSNWRVWETRERRSWRDEKERTILVPFISPIASCAAELKICNLVSKSISTPAWPTEQSQTIQFQFKSSLLALF